MNILITGAKGFVGRNLTENLKNLRDGKNRTRPNIQVGEIYEYDIDSTAKKLDEYCAKADFVFNLAGVNRPKDPAEFKAGNFGFASTLLDTLKKHHNTSPVMLSSSIQATLAGRFGTSEYGLSKRAGTFLQPLSLCIFLQFSPILLDKSIKAYKNRATGVNVVSVGSPSRILIVRRISFGMTTLPSSSMRRTIPVAFIYNSPVNVIFGIRRIMRRNTLKKVFREYYLHNALIYSRFCDKNHSTSPFHKRCRKDT